MITKNRILISLIVLTLTVFGYHKVIRFFEIDNCLDHGGSWDYNTENCDYGLEEYPRAIWYTDYDTVTKSDVLIKGDKLKDFNTSLDSILFEFNSSTDMPLTYVKTLTDTLYVKVENAEQLTQRMGSTGADWYLASATFTLLEIDNINAIHFDFEEGDHASPGTRTKKDFIENYRILE